MLFSRKENVRFLGFYDGNRDNNFTAIRLTLAWLVLFGHSFAITKTSAGVIPITFFGGKIWLGAIAVNGFFAISGFFVAGSFARRGPSRYAFARFFRVFPAVAVCVLFCVVLLGPVYTSLPLADYFSQSTTLKYLTHNSMLWPHIRYDLPGVFASHPFSSINGSLWTILPEVRCYMLLFLAGLFGLFKNTLVASILVVMVLFVGYYEFTFIPLL